MRPELTCLSLSCQKASSPLQTPHTGPQMTSCWKSMRDSCSWLLRWPQTRNLSFHSSDREICSVALKRSPVDRELAGCHVAGVLLPPVSVPSVSQPEAAFFICCVRFHLLWRSAESHFYLLTVVVSHTTLSLSQKKKTQSVISCWTWCNLIYWCNLSVVA